MVPPLLGVAEVVGGEHAQPEAHLGANGIERDVERLLGDRELGHAHRHDAAATPDEENERRHGRQDLERARGRLRGNRKQLAAGRVDQRLEHRELRRDAEIHRSGVAVGKLELVGGVDLGLELDALDRRALEPERLRALAGAVAAGALHLQRARQRVRIVLQRDNALHL